jgi:hypothetical protein
MKPRTCEIVSVLASLALAGCAMEVSGEEDDDGLAEVEAAGTCISATGKGAHPKVSGAWFEAIYSVDMKGVRAEPKDKNAYGYKIQFGPWVDNANSMAYAYNADGTAVIDGLYYRFLDSQGKVNGCNRQTLDFYTKAKGSLEQFAVSYACSIGTDGAMVACPNATYPFPAPFGGGDDRLKLTLPDDETEADPAVDPATKEAIIPLDYTMYRRCTSTTCTKDPTKDLNDEW